ncbi:PREDICTED: glutathione S-transferase T3-like [Camelina sativa]|uniref:Glutathione S-transferase T3-like n=1 Tax=Camelina sativa TaxID=90675 RepID=A0ABM0ZC60_CAMSA|nr:PREDICTED: glutathione S-transferase T3-like [Camelina sativa]
MSSYNTFSQSSSSYVDLLNSQGDTLNLDGAYEVPPYSSQESHQDVPLSQETHVRKERKKWNPADDEALISAWLNTSKDPIIGNQQKGGSFWQRVNKYYADTPHAIANGEQGMNINCKQRWFRINEWTNKFCGAYAAAERLNSSGHSENDVLKMAHDIYFAEHNMKFTMEHCWCLLRFEQKWLNLNTINNPSTNVRTKRKVVAAASQSEGGSQSEPQGCKAAKAKRNNAKGKALAEYKSMWEVKRVDMAEKEKLQKLGILDTLLAKPEPLGEVDQLIKDKIMGQDYSYSQPDSSDQYGQYSNDTEQREIEALIRMDEAESSFMNAQARVYPR